MKITCKVRLAFILLTACFLSWPICAQKNRLLEGELITQNRMDTLPLQYLNNLLFIQVTINEIPRKFLLDTGAPTIISTSLQNEIALDTLFNKRLTDTHGSFDSIPFVLLNSLSLGKLKIEKIPVGVIDFKKSFLGCFGIDGILGSNALRQLSIKIDVRSSRIIITDGQGLLIKKEPTEVKFDQQYSPYLKIKPEPRTSEEVLFDTGFNGFYSLSNRNYYFFKKQNRLKNTVRAEGIGSSTFGLYGLGTPEKIYLLQLRFIEINKVRMPNQLVSTGRGQNSKLGSGIFKYGIVTLDYRNSKFWFEPFLEKHEVVKHWGFEPAFLNKKPIVGLVWSNSNAEKAGMVAGQHILKVNGSVVSTFTLCDMFKNWETTDKLELELQQNEVVKTIILTQEIIK